MYTPTFQYSNIALTNSPFLDVCLLWSVCLCLLMLIAYLYSLLEQSVFRHNSFLARLSTFSGASSAKGPIHLPIWRDHQIVIKILFKNFVNTVNICDLPSRELTYPTKREVRKIIDSKGAGDCRGYVIVPSTCEVWQPQKTKSPSPEVVQTRWFHHGLAFQGTSFQRPSPFPRTTVVPLWNQSIAPHVESPETISKIWSFGEE